MLEFDAAEKLISEALAAGHIGAPVAVRTIARGATASDLSRCLASAAFWLQSRPARIECVPQSAAEQTTQLIAFEGGQTALLSTSVARLGNELLQITVFGNHGMLNWNEPPQASRSAPVAAPLLRTPVRQPLEPPYGVVLVAGDHTHQPIYASAFAADSRCRLIGLTDDAGIGEPRRILNRQLADRLEIPLLEDFDRAVARDDVHIVSICAEPMRRGPLIVRAAAAGKHLYLDKPLAGSPDDLEQVVAAVRQSHVLAHMFSSLTASPIARMRQTLQSGNLGRLLAIHLDLCFAKGMAGTAQLGSPRRETYPPASYEVADAKRELTNVGVYPLVLLAALCRQSGVCPDFAPRRVAATTGNYFFAEHQQQDMEDFGQIVLELDDGLVASCTAGRTGWQSHPADGLNRVTLIGSDDVAVIEAHRPRVEIWSDATAWQPPPRNPLDPMGMWVALPGSPYIAAPKNNWRSAPALSPQADVSYFLHCLQTGCDSEVGAETAALASRILLAAYRSAAEGTGVQPV
ncbi:MAG: Gfo/Idh/MocA family oxidoreductase [Pirellulaceae bacterium]|nr:Gfo/Idh/MocA family oxidoreductase [Pirellulaceae bacterium]